MEPSTFILFGATGDLAKRKIYPALFRLFVEQKLPPSFSLIGLGRREWTDETFQANIEQAIRMFSRTAANDADMLGKFLLAFRYQVLDVGRQEDYKKLLERVEQREQEQRIPPNRLFYLSVGPELFATIATNIQESGLGSATGSKRLMIEKPFGHDLPSARKLNDHLNQSFAENEIYRIDHYLGKPMVQQMGEMLHSEQVVKEIGASRKIANVQISASETLGVEDRAGYYDHSGAIRDMFQNHMLQLLMMLTVDMPIRSKAGHVGNRKIKTMKALESINPIDMNRHIVRGQYGEGEIGGKAVPAYVAEPGIPVDSMNDTFIAARLTLDDPFWKDVPIYIRTGKRMNEKSTRIVIEFDSVGPLKDLLIIEIGPNEGIYYQSRESRNGKVKEASAPRPLIAMKDGAPEAYEVLIYDALRGDKSFFAHWDEVELSWEWVQPVLDAFEHNLVPLRIYPAGTQGPRESNGLLEQDGFHWWSEFHTVPNNDANKGEKFVYEFNA